MQQSVQLRGSSMQRLRNELKINIFEKQLNKGNQLSPEKQRFFILIQIYQDRTLNSQKNVETPILKSLIHQPQSELLFGEKYELEEEHELGQGCHSIVKLATLRNPDWNNPERFAVKLCRSGDPEIVNTSIETFKNQMILDHPYIVKALELYIDENTETHYLVMEHCPYPSIEDLIISRNIKLEEPIIKSIFFSCFQAITHMHERGIAHRDLKPDNILVQYPPKLTDSYPLKIIDFGVSAKFKLIDQRSKFFSLRVKDMWTRTGTHFYCAPEIFSGGGYDEKVDIWAMGITLYQLLSGGKLPFESETIVDTIESIERDELNLESQEWKKISQLGKDILRRMLHKNPKERINAKECLLHPWFYKNVDQQKKRIKSSFDIDHFENERVEQFYEKNQHYKCNTLKEYIIEKTSKKSMNSFNILEIKMKSANDNQFQKQKKSTNLMDNNEIEQDLQEKEKIHHQKIVWDNIQIGSSIKDNEETFSPLIKISKMEQTIKKSMHIKKKQIRQFFLPNFKKRYTMISITNEDSQTEDLRTQQRRKTLSLMNTKESFDQHLE